MADIRRAIEDRRFEDFRRNDPRVSIGPTGKAEAHSF